MLNGGAAKDNEPSPPAHLAPFGAGGRGGDRLSSEAFVPLPRREFAAYSIGHVLNDMCAACWFSFLLIYLERAVGLNPALAGVVMFSGQVGDAIATPTVGILSDKSSGCPAIGFGRRKAWYAGGTVVVLLCYSAVWTICLPCLGPGAVGNTVKTIYYACAASVFNFGWASVQVSHMALVPELSSCDSERTQLNSARYAFTVISNVLVFCVMSGLLKFLPDGYGHVDRSRPYTILGLTVVGLGTLTSVLFLMGVVEPLQPLDDDEGSRSASSDESRVSCDSSKPLLLDDGESARVDEEKALIKTGQSVQRPRTPGGSKKMTALDWLKTRRFYEVGVLYMLTRLVVNVSQVYLPFLVDTTLHMSPTSIAVVPLIVYIASFGASLVMKPLNARYGRKVAYAIGAACCVLASVSFLLLTRDSASVSYASAVFLGAGNAAIMVTSVSLEADLVGKNTESGAFVYGALSFTDKLSNGIVILAVQIAKKHLAHSHAREARFIRMITGVVPLVAAVLGLAVVMFSGATRPLNIRKRNSDKFTDAGRQFSMPTSHGKSDPNAPDRQLLNPVDA